MDRTAVSRQAAGIRITETAVSEAVEFEAVVRTFRPKIFRFALASLRDADAADMVTQDCLLRAHRAWKSFRGDCATGTWLMQIAVNLVRDYGRSHRFQFWRRAVAATAPLEAVSQWFADGGNSPEKQALLKQQVRAVWEAANLLPERQRTVFLLRFVEDMDLLEIAAATGMKEGTVKTHLFRALRSVRERMGAEL